MGGEKKNALQKIAAAHCTVGFMGKCSHALTVNCSHLLFSDFYLSQSSTVKHHRHCAAITFIHWQERNTTLYLVFTDVMHHFMTRLTIQQNILIFVMQFQIFVV